MYDEFSTWIYRQTGLKLYDFRVLDDDGTSAEWVKKLFDSWKKTARPDAIARAVKDAADEGFSV